MKLFHFISGGDIGGAKTHVLSLLSGIGKIHDVTLVCFMEGAFAQEARMLGIHTVVLPGQNLPAVCKKLLSLCKGKADLIHCHGARANLMGALLKPHLDVPIVTTIHSDPKLDYLGRPLSNLIFGNANQWALKKMDGWICVSLQLREMMIAAGRDPQKIFTIPNGVDFSDLSCKLDRKAFWDSVGLDVPEDGIVYGIAARLSPVKDIGTLIRAFAKSAKKDPRLRLAIAGEGTEQPALEQLAKELCPAGSYRFLGWLTDTASFYHALDVNMLSSLSEGLPYAIAEGARMGCTTISTRVGAIPTIVEDGVTGFLVEPKDVDAMSERMTRIAEDSALRSRLGQAIFERVRRDYSMEAMVRTQTEIYRRVLKQFAAQDRQQVLISGAYGRGNLGDEAILASLLQQLRKHDPDVPICVLSKSPRETSLHNNVRSIYTFSYWKIHKELKKTRLFISGGGSLIQDATSSRSLLYYLYTIRKAHHMGCKVMMYGCGIGPVSKKPNRNRTTKVLNENVDLITLRDPSSMEALQSLHVEKPQALLTADPALLQEISQEQRLAYEAYCHKAGLQPNGRYCLFSLRPWHTTKALIPQFSRAAEFVYKTYGLTPVFALLEPEKDRAITEEVAAGLCCPYKILPEIESGGMICALMQQMQLVVSMRLHALIFAAGQGVPLAGISYDPKVTGFLDYMGQGSYVTLENLTAESLCKCIRKAMQEKDSDSTRLEELRDLARKNGDYALDFLEGPGRKDENHETHL